MHAVWRRCQITIELGNPTLKQVLLNGLRTLSGKIGLSLEHKLENLVSKLNCSNFAEIEEFGHSVFRQFASCQPKFIMKDIAYEYFIYWATRSIKSEEKTL